jgi:hypothetical protein
MRYRGGGGDGDYPGYGNQQYSNKQYGNQQYSNQQYGNQQYGNQENFDGNAQENLEEANELLNEIKENLYRNPENQSLINDIDNILQKLNTTNINKVINYLRNLNYNKNSNVSTIQTIISDIQNNLNSWFS